MLLFSSSKTLAVLVGTAHAVQFTMAATSSSCDRSNCIAPESICTDITTCTVSAAALMFDSMAKFATQDSTATYASTTSKTFPDLFACVINDVTDNLPESQHMVWQGFVDYAAANENVIYIENDSGTLVEAMDVWGDRCESEQECEILVDRYQECPDRSTCVPQTLHYPVGNVDMDIYEPCNFVSNLAFSRVMPQLCGSNFYMNQDTLVAFVHSFAALAAGSSIWHGSHTYLGFRADNQLISVVAYLNHQVIISSLEGASTQLVNIQAQARLRTAEQIAMDVSKVLQNQHVSEWPQELVDLDMPEYRSTFAVIVASVLSILFPDRDASITALVTTLAGALDANSMDLETIYLPELQQLSQNLNLSAAQKFTLFRQLLGMGAKMVFAFLWQEQVLQIDYFLTPGANQMAPDVLPPLVKLFNFVTGFIHVDDDFQTFNGMYPGDDTCRATVPHAKWHELSASALLDLIYLSDCVKAVVSGGPGSTCAHMGNLDGLGEITRAEISAWIDDNIQIPAIPIIKDIVPLFIEEIFLIFDVNNDDIIDWADVNSLVDTIEDIVGHVTAKIQLFMDMFENFCTADSQCDSQDEFCNVLQFGCRPKRENGFFPCIKDSQCYSDRCVDTTRVCAAKVEEGGTCVADKECVNGLTCATVAGVGVCGRPCTQGCTTDEWCNNNYSPDICRPKRENGYFPCDSDIQCYSDRCVDTTRVCAAKVEEGGACVADKECADGLECATVLGVGICGRPCTQGCTTGEWCNNNYSPDICRPKRENGYFPCDSDAQCISDRCVDTTRVCEAKKPNGSSCLSDKECLSDNCRWFKCRS